LLYTTTIALAMTAATANAGDALSFADPKGDDNGSGKAVYPTEKAYTAGAFDMVKLTISEDGADTVFEVEVAQAISDPWDSKSWGGNGFSVQFVQIYLDTDGKKRSGEKKGVPGSGIEFAPDGYYEKVVLISPQPKSKILGELEAKARWLKSRWVIPARTEARRKSIVARVPTAELGGAPNASWGVQAVMLSNEGFPAPEDVLSRKINEFNGEHRFGGGCDGFGDPQIVDMFAGSGKGEASEIEAQHKVLSNYTCADESKNAKYPQLGFVRK
jgi:carbohydrate-binding DOMON domain-containing protein